MILSQKNSLSSWPFNDRETIINELNNFVDSLIINLTETIQRNISGCFPSETFFKTVSNLDPSQNLNFNSITSSDISHFLQFDEKTSLLNELNIISSIKDVSSTNHDENLWTKKGHSYLPFQRFLRTY